MTAKCSNFHLQPTLFRWLGVFTGRNGLHGAAPPKARAPLGCSSRRDEPVPAPRCERAAVLLAIVFLACVGCSKGARCDDTTGKVAPSSLQPDASASQPEGNTEPVPAKPLTWPQRDTAFEIVRGILSHAPANSNGSPIAQNPGPRFTYEEQMYDKPSRDWWWEAGKFTVIILGSLVLTYGTVGVAAPFVGGMIGGIAGLNGAAAVSYGLAILGGGAIAAGGFGMAGGTVVIGLITDLAISTTLEYSLKGLRSTEGLKPLEKAIKYVDANHDQSGAWQALSGEATGLAANPQNYVTVSHGIASAFMRLSADENIENALSEEPALGSGVTMSDCQKVLITCALSLLEECRRLEPRSSLVHHALGNLYWWLSVRGGYELPADAPKDFLISASSRLIASGHDEMGCFRAALWHYAEGSACEPRNVNIRVNWANALQADGTVHEAIAVLAGSLPYIESCRPTDQAQLLRTNSMLQYQAFARSTKSEPSTPKSPFPSLQDSPLLMAAMQGYTEAVRLEPGDLGSLTSLAQIYRAAEPTRLDNPQSVLSLEDVCFRFMESVLKQENDLAAMTRTDLPSGYTPGQLLDLYKDLLQWSFGGVGQLPLKDKTLKRLYSAVDGWLKFASSHGLRSRPFDRGLVFRLHEACKKYNDESWVSDYSLEAIDKELSTKE